MKSYILHSELTDAGGGFVQHRNTFDLILHATPPQKPARQIRRRAFLTWTAADHVAIFAKIRTWWETFGRANSTRRSKTSLFRVWEAVAFTEFMRGLWDVIREVILPKTKRGSRLGTAILEFVHEVRDHGLPVGSVMPATLFVSPESEAKTVASALRREFAHTEAAFSISALRGLNHWAELSRPHLVRPTDFPAIPPDLLREVGTTVAARRPGLVRPALQASVYILKRLRTSADKRFRDNLLVGLEYLFADPPYPLMATDAGSVAEYDKIPSIRVEAVELAKCLSDLGYSGHEVVRRWLTAAGQDPLPEVRRAASITLDTPDY